MTTVREGGINGPEELAAAERQYGRARVIQTGPRGITAYASIRGRYLGLFDMSSHEGATPGFNALVNSE